MTQTYKKVTVSPKKKIENIESDLVPKFELLELFFCPFISQCVLPKHHFLCKVSGCQTCSEYIAKFNELT